VEKIVGKIVVTGVLAATLAVPSWAEGFNSQFSGPLVEVDGYNAVLGAIASFSGPTAPLNPRFSDLGIEFRGRPVELDAYNLALGTASAPDPSTILTRATLPRPAMPTPACGKSRRHRNNNASGGSRVGSVIKLQWMTGKLGPLAGAHHPTLSCSAVLESREYFAIGEAFAADPRSHQCATGPQSG
jgi:hypothetical protein